MNSILKNKRRTFLILTLIIISISLFTLSACNKEKLKVHFLDVGQGDSTLIELPNSKVVLIDGGNKADSDFLVDYIKNLDIKTIDYIIATHPHADHIGGLPQVIEEFDIGKVYMPRVTSNTQIFEQLLIEIKKKDIKIIQAKSGMIIVDKGDLKLTILSPTSDKYKKINDYSIVNKLIYKDISLLFTGDAETTAENELINNKDLSTDILKVAHHGSNSSSSDKFLDSVKPKYAIISCGQGNKYGHPDSLVLKRLKERKIKILRTDEIGTIILKSDGKSADFRKSK